MNSLTSNGTDNLPQAALPPKPDLTQVDEPVDEPLFEDVQVIEEKVADTSNLDNIAKKLKEESITEQENAPVVVKTKKPLVIKPVSKKTQASSPIQVAKSAAYYIQVGSFSKYAPNKKFLKSITDLKYNYKYHKVQNLNKVLIGPFDTKKAAQNARRTIRAKIEPGAFLIKL